MNAAQLFISGLIAGWFLGVVSLIFLVRAIFQKEFKNGINYLHDRYKKALDELREENEKLKQKIT